MELSVFFVIWFGIFSTEVCCFPGNRIEERLSYVEHIVEDIRRELNTEADFRREDIATLYAKLAGSFGLGAKFLDGRLFGNRNSRMHFSDDISTTNDQLNNSMTQFREEAVKIKDQLLLEIKHMEDIYNQKILSQSEEKAPDFRKSSMKVKFLIQSMNTSLDNFTSHVMNYTSKFQNIFNTFAETHENKDNTRAKRPTSCKDVNESGIHTIYPDFNPSGIAVYCEINENKDWLVIQRRKYGTVDFQRSWDEYKAGFGDINGDFWLGNEYIYQLTKFQSRQLRIDMETFEGKKVCAMYNEFGVSSEAGKFTLKVGGYSGDAGDQLAYHNGQMFSTYDADNDKNSGCCACGNEGGWWYNNCWYSRLNGKYYYKHEISTSGGIHWNGLSGTLKYVEIKIH
ncbi:ficolin-2-like isoform X1 [Dreissena polymorpha]|uniref:ficolin-2-like isoform X1 n=1 Tax=Dreissena polymorpha TaxID=45954 RepID=UPI0022646DE2|nr:ficolin-2-like isoform X1 [Dreissena polymorpha]